jgi:hypothetical protein
MRERLEWLEGREAHFYDKITNQLMEINKLKQDAREAKKSLQVESIKATLKTIQGISTANKRIQVMPHEMDAAHQRISAYNIKWNDITIPPREINPFPIPLKIVDWEVVEKCRLKDHPDDKQQIPLSFYMRSYEHKAGGNKEKDEGSDDKSSRRGRGDSNPRYRGYRGRGRGYRG